MPRTATPFPDASFEALVRPNVDTLYSSLWYDVSAEPLGVSIPDPRGRNHLVPLTDMCTEIFA